MLKVRRGACKTPSTAAGGAGKGWMGPALSTSCLGQHQWGTERPMAATEHQAMCVWAAKGQPHAIFFQRWLLRRQSKPARVSVRICTASPMPKTNSISSTSVQITIYMQLPTSGGQSKEINLRRKLLFSDLTHCLLSCQAEESVGKMQNHRMIQRCIHIFTAKELFIRGNVLN